MMILRTSSLLCRHKYSGVGVQGRVTIKRTSKQSKLAFDYFTNRARVGEYVEDKLWWFLLVHIIGAVVESIVGYDHG